MSKPKYAHFMADINALRGLLNEARAERNAAYHANDAAHDAIIALEFERDGYKRKTERIRPMHQIDVMHSDDPSCARCGDPWPCVTVRIIDGEL